MIDINELRQSLGAIQTEEVAELLDRLEAAEADALEQARLNGMGSEREAALMAKLEAAEKERDKLKELNSALYTNSNSQVIHNARLAEENYALRAKVEAMEKQEPVAEWIENRFHQYPQLVWNKKYRVNIGDKLYALPCAKGEEK